MAYGIDYEGIYYTDENRNDIGMMDTYKASLDLADEKDFEVTANDYAIPQKGWWYILGTEIGGKIGAIDVDSESGTIKYTGRSFRGLLDSYVCEITGATRLLQGSITDIIQMLLDEEGVTFFQADSPDVEASIDTYVDAYEIDAGATIYEAIIGAAASIDMTIAIEWQSDHIIHIIPILKQDFTDYLKYSGVEQTGFQIKQDYDLVNHLVLTSKDDAGNFRVIHMFTDSGGTVQAYKTTDTPYEASDYILDRSMQVLTGQDEIAEWKDCDDSPVDKYKAVSSMPGDWDKNYDDYYYKDTEEDSDGTVEISYKNFEGVESDSMTLTTSKPSDWDTNYASYYTPSYDQSTGTYTYSAVTGETVLDMSNVIKITAQPFDWAYNYAEYYYKFNNGSSVEYKSYASTSKDKYVRMTSKPSDWNTNFGSYYRKVYKKITYKTVNGKKTKVTEIVDCLDRSDAYYVTCKKDDDEKNGKIPSFTKRPHYRKDNKTVIPTFDKTNTYHMMTKTTPPTWAANKYYSGRKDVKAPPFDALNTYELKKDHYESLCKTGLDFFAELESDSMRAITIDDLSANIGDTVGGTDAMTGISIVAEVTNNNLTIEKGIVTSDYEIGGK